MENISFQTYNNSFGHQWRRDIFLNLHQWTSTVTLAEAKLFKITNLNSLKKDLSKVNLTANEGGGLSYDFQAFPKNPNKVKSFPNTFFTLLIISQPFLNFL